MTKEHFTADIQRLNLFGLARNCRSEDRRSQDLFAEAHRVKMVNAYGKHTSKAGKE